MHRNVHTLKQVEVARLKSQLLKAGADTSAKRLQGAAREEHLLGQVQARRRV